MDWPRRQIGTVILLMLAYSLAFNVGYMAITNLIQGNQGSMLLLLLCLLIAGLIAVPASLFWGLTADFAGRRTVLAVDMAGIGLSFILMDVTGQPLLFIALFLAEVFAACTLPVALAALVDVTGPAARSGVMGLLMAALSAGPVAGQVAYQLSVGTIPHMALIAGVILLLMAVPLYIFVMDTGKQRRATDRQYNPATGSEIPPTPNWLVILAMITIITVLVYFAANIIGPYYSFYTWSHSKDIQGPSPGFAYTILYGIVVIVVQALLVRLSVRRLGEMGTIAWGLLLALGGSLLIAAWIDMAVEGVIAAVAGTSLAMPCLFSIFSRHVSARWQGLAMGLLAAICSLGAFIGSSMSKLLIGTFETYLLVPAIFGIAVALLLSYMTLRISGKSDPTAIATVQ